MMRKIFTSVNGDRITDIIDYSLNVVKENPDAKIYIGGDSKRVNRKTCYVIVVAFRFGNKGVHYVYHKEVKPTPKTKWDRLLTEIELVINFAQWFMDNTPLRVHAIDLDLNQDEKYYSNKLHSIGKGWGESLGVPVYTKPDEVVASKAADHIVNKFSG